MPEDSLPPGHRSALFSLLLIAALIVYASYAILLLWKEPYLLGLCLLPAPLALMARLGPSGPATVVAGAVIGPLTETACVAGGLWSYAETGGLPLIPPWLPVIWACFPAALWLIAKSLLGEVPSPDRGALPFCLAGIILEIVLFLTLGHSLPLIFGAALLLGAAAVLAVPSVERSTVMVLMATGGVLGPVCEALPVAAGAWSYAQPDVLGLPLWLPLAYALFAVLVSYGARSLAEGYMAK